MKKRIVSRKAAKPKTWLITALLAAGAVAYVVFVFLPSQQKIADLRAQVHERRQQIMQAQSLAGTVVQARVRLAASREVAKEWKGEAPRQTDFASITKQADEAGVVIDRLDPLPAVQLRLIAQQNVTLLFHAPFAAVFSLLQRLEALPGTLWIRDLRLNAPSANDNTLRGELTLTIFADRADYAN